MLKIPTVLLPYFVFSVSYPVVRYVGNIFKVNEHGLIPREGIIKWIIKYGKIVVVSTIRICNL